MATESRLRANAKYEAKAYDKIMLRVPKGQREEIKKVASLSGKSTAAYITEAIKEKMEREEPQE